MSGPLEGVRVIDLTGTVAIVTGGAHGLGRVIVESLARAGATVTIFDLNEAATVATTQELTVAAPGGAVFGRVGDLTNAADLKGLVEETIARSGQIDVVVHNGGMTLRSMPEGDRGTTVFTDFSQEQFRRFLEQHVLGAFELSRLVAPKMREQRWGRIISVTTSLDTMVRGGQAPYGPTKAAMEALTSVMAHDLAGTGVTANVLVPGGSVNTHGRPPRGAGLRPFIPAEVMAAPAVWLASRASDGVTAQRFIGELWDPAIELASAITASGAPIAWPSTRDA
jgi:3-oxoacyl-[acyl-carrier protein] reductase